MRSGQPQVRNAPICDIHRTKAVPEKPTFVQVLALRSLASDNKIAFELDLVADVTLRTPEWP
jgi:hypothetical protein